MNPLSLDQLYRRCDPSLLDFATTAELPDLDHSFGQARAEEAVRFGIDIQKPGYNLFVLGEPGSGRHTIVRQLIEEKAGPAPMPADWCYLNNFDDPHKPRALKLPPGRGAQLKRDMQQFVGELATVIGSAFESDEYRSRLEAIQEEFKQREEGALQELGQEALKEGVALLHSPHGFAFAPVKGDETMSPDEFNALPEDERARIGKTIDVFGERLQKLLHQFPRWRRELQGRIKEASRDTMRLAVGHMIEELKEHHADLPEVLDFLDKVLEDVVEAGEDLREQQKVDGDSGGLMTGTISLQRYQVNLLVEHPSDGGAPIVHEDNPTFQNLVGRFDHVAHMGTLATNFTLIKAGALHRANGGYLLLDAIKLLSQPYAWEGLKRTLRSGQIRIESLSQIYGLMSTLPLEPEPIPIDLKVVLFGERFVYYLLREYDPEFSELFKVGADFESEVPRDDASVRLYARLIGRLVQHDGLRPLSADAVARVIEHGSRLAGDADKLSTRTRRIDDLLREADHLAGKAGSETIGRDHIEAALAAAIRRADRLRVAIQDEVLRGTLLIATSGAEVGQINGLAVIDLGEFRFAHPVRITATARLGEGDLIDIEREAELGGPIHTKGVMILSSFLASRYARSMPLSVAASLVFEQSYGGVEGDSASLAELCALLSALAAVPIKQSLAVTGSVNQYGRVQPIGGVNEKIEGFFDICRQRGLDGEQGVLIPESNVKHLMLRQDVVDACREGRFRIWAVSTVDEAIALLTGVPAGEPDENGVVAEGTVNYLVASELAEMAELRQRFGKSGKRGGKRKEGQGD